MSTYKGDILDVIYFALTPFDTMFSGVLCDGFILNVNGIFVSTHKKLFKYRSLVNSAFRIGLIMNFIMMFVQISMIVLMAKRILNSHYFNDKSNYYPSVVGDCVVILFFVFDFVNNCLLAITSKFLIENSYLISNDYTVRLQKCLQPEEQDISQSLLGKKELNSVVSKFNIDFRKIAYVKEDEK